MLFPHLALDTHSRSLSSTFPVPSFYYYSFYNRLRILLLQVTMQLPYRFSPALIAFLVPTIVSQTLITPCSDGQCTNPLTNFTYDGIEAWSPDFGLGSGWPSSTGYENLVFQNASSPDNAEGYTVYWNITSPEPGCRVIFMLPYTEGGYDKVVDNQPEGNIILNVGEPGCYYTNLPVSSVLYLL